MHVNLAQFPCCGGSVHTGCAIQYMMLTGPVMGYVMCPICHDVLQEGVSPPEVHVPPAYHYDSPSENASVVQAEVTTAARMADPEFRAGVRAVRSKIREAQKANGAMRRRMAERSVAFREAVAPHVAAIRDAKREAQAEIRHYPEVREASRARAAALRAKTVFAKREHLGYWQARELFRGMPYGRRRSRYYNDPDRRRFWIGI